MKLQTLSFTTVLIFTTQAQIIKQEFSVDTRTGQTNITSEQESNDRCYQFTWLGMASRDMAANSSSGFPSCSELSDAWLTTYGRAIPCYEPTVYTVNDGNGHNRPNLTDLEAQCQEVGCDPFCSRAGDACITYTVLNNDDEGTVEIESKFCGQVQRMWDGAVVTNGRCYTEYGVGGAQDHQVCFCDDIDRCNRAGRDLASTLMLLLLSILVYMLL